LDSVAEGVGSQADDLTLPGSGTDYLHLMEDVHMTIFLGMIFYFTLVHEVCRSAKRIFIQWEQMDLTAVGDGTGNKTAAIPKQVSAIEHAAGSFHQDMFTEWRKYFFAGVAHMESKIPEIREEVLSCLPESERANDGKALDSKELIDRALQHWFPFGKYLAMNTRLVMDGMIEFSLWTWLATVMLFILFSVLARFAHVSIREAYPVYIAVCVFLLAFTGLWARYAESRIHSAATFKQRESKFYESFQVEAVLIRMTQISFFFLSYCTGSAFVGKDLTSEEAIATFVAFIILHIVLRFSFGQRIVRFMAVSSFGEYLSEDNWRFLKYIIEARKHGATQKEMSMLSVDAALEADEHEA